MNNILDNLLCFYEGCLLDFVETLNFIKLRQPVHHLDCVDMSWRVKLIKSEVLSASMEIITFFGYKWVKSHIVLKI